jgi:hypothetical protein
MAADIEKLVLMPMGAARGGKSCSTWAKRLTCGHCQCDRAAMLMRLVVIKTSDLVAQAKRELKQEGVAGSKRLWGISRAGRLRAAQTRLRS